MMPRSTRLRIARVGGISRTDRYKGYLWLPQRQRQICWGRTALP